jgi:small Trp-rich protein
MLLLAIGVLLLIAKLAELGPAAEWSWWIILAPFGAAAVWWQIADSTGLTQRRAIEKMERRKTERRDRALEALGQSPRMKQGLQDRQVAQAREEANARRQSADPTMTDRSAAEDQPPRRDPTR